MFDKISLAGSGLVGIIVYVLVLVAKYLGLDVAESDLTTQVSNIVGAIGFVMALIGQYKRKDLVGGIIRK